MDETRIWEIRAFVYRHFAETTRPPHVDETASFFSLSHQQAADAYDELQKRHALLLVHGTHEIQMAWPFSSVETPFKVQANGRTYFANCAWDSLGIPAALQSDAEIETVCSQSGDIIRLSVSGQRIGASDALVHFLVPFQSWYDDLTFT